MYGGFGLVPSLPRPIIQNAMLCPDIRRGSLEMLGVPPVQDLVSLTFNNNLVLKIILNLKIININKIN